MVPSAPTRRTRSRCCSSSSRRRPELQKDRRFSRSSSIRLNIIPYNSINAILDHYIEEYLTDSQIESVGHEVAYIVDDFFIDDNPAERMDSTATLLYTGKVPVEATAENYRRPSNIA